MAIKAATKITAVTPLIDAYTVGRKLRSTPSILTPNKTATTTGIAKEAT